jgi:hypothetical protein
VANGQDTGDADGQGGDAGEGGSGMHRLFSPEMRVMFGNARLRYFPPRKAENNAPDSPPDIRRRMRVYRDRLMKQ